MTELHVNIFLQAEDGISCFQSIPLREVFSNEAPVILDMGNGKTIRVWGTAELTEKYYLENDKK